MHNQTHNKEETTPHSSRSQTLNPATRKRLPIRLV